MTDFLPKPDPHTDPYGNKKVLSTWKELGLAFGVLFIAWAIGSFLGCLAYHWITG